MSTQTHKTRLRYLQNTD